MRTMKSHLNAATVFVGILICATTAFGQSSNPKVYNIYAGTRMHIPSILNTMGSTSDGLRGPRNLWQLTPMVSDGPSTPR